MNIAAIPEAGQVWVHIESQQKYVVNCVTNTHAEKLGWERHVVYHTENEPFKVWSRPLEGFMLKFQRVG